jgi:hypothetical protein
VRVILRTQYNRRLLLNIIGTLKNNHHPLSHLDTHITPPSTFSILQNAPLLPPVPSWVLVLLKERALRMAWRRVFLPTARSEMYTDDQPDGVVLGAWGL